MDSEDYLYMLESAKEHLEEIDKMYYECLKLDYVPKKLTNKIRYFLTDIESALDYISYIVFNKYCLPKLCENKAPSEKIERLKKQVNFPLFDQEEWFNKKMKKAFPYLDETKPEIIATFEKYQVYNTSKDYWLPIFNRLVNNNKHRELEKQSKEMTAQVNYFRDDNGNVFQDVYTDTHGIIIDGKPLATKVLNSTRDDTVANIKVNFFFKEMRKPVMPTLKMIYTEANIVIDEFKIIIEGD